MNFFQVVILGLIEGATEFLPISSTAHLIITSSLLNLPQNELVSLFEVFIQFGAIVAIIVLFWNKIVNHREYFFHTLVAFIPTGIVGVFMYRTIKDVFFQSYPLIASSLIIVGALFILTEWLLQKKHITLTKTLSDMTFKEALLIGLIQSCAVIPGVSRAGAVIIAMIFMKYKRSDAAFFSFLLAIPTIIAASTFNLLDTNMSLLTPTLIQQLSVGSIVSFISALICVKWFVSYLEKHTTSIFGIYRIALGIAILFSLSFLHL